LLPDLRSRSIDRFSEEFHERAVIPPSYGYFMSPVGSPNAALSFAFGWSGIGSLATHYSNPNPVRLSDRSLSPHARNSGSADGLGSTTEGRMGRDGIHATCGENEQAARLQAGSVFWTAQKMNTAPAQFPPDVLTGTAKADAEPSGDPTLGPNSDRTNLPTVGPGSGWCNPRPIPLAKSDLLESRKVWLPVALVIAGIVVFWVSRGIKMPS
jgi:hypothetical protein